MNHAGRRSGACMGRQRRDGRDASATPRLSSCPPVDLPRDGVGTPILDEVQRKEQRGGSPIQYSEEFKRDTAALVRSTGSSTPTARSVAWCSASIWSGPDGNGLLTMEASSVQKDPDGSRRIVWMIKRMIKLVPRPESFALFDGCRLSSRRGQIADSVAPRPSRHRGALSTTWYGGPGRTAWRVRQRARERARQRCRRRRSRVQWLRPCRPPHHLI
jgi:hypothetical protein